ncbi:DUF294 nucleotidyltransferase-like domain-containing protein [Roseivirga sp. BDSF3-8]|uniref:DUF294 nucleotidyltransferase-like domain-containing protein n=1 Tax=Roseivirga sp. BDSF3-8 TaxID=3241598 RepID=UPI0035326A44
MRAVTTTSKDQQLSFFLKEVVPFDRLPEEELKILSDKLSTRHYAPNTLIHTQSVSPVRHLSIVYSGRVEKYFLNRNKQKEFLEYVLPGEIYGGISLLLNNRRSIRTVIAAEETKIYNLTAEDFLRLCQKYERFSSYFTDRFGRRMLNQTYSGFVNNKPDEPVSYEQTDHFFKQKVKEISRPLPVTCSLDTSIREAAALMTAHRSPSVLISGENQILTGIITDLDLRNKVVAKGLNAERPVSEIMSNPLISIDEDCYLYEAVLKMFREKVHQLVVCKGKEAVGVISRNKLLHSQVKSPFIFMQSILTADLLEELVRKWGQVPDIVNQLLSRGVRAEIVNQVISTASDSISQNIIQQTIREMGDPPCRFVFMVLGSEGRREQTLKTDQDNAIIYEDVEDSDRAMVREYFLEFAEKVSFKLDQTGFAYCEGDLMAKNPKWCHSLSHWKRNYRTWVTSPDPEKAMRSAIFFDCRAVYGDETLLTSLRGHILELLHNPSQTFFYLLAKNGLEIKPPLGLFNNFHTVSHEDKKGVINIKRAMSIVVDFARVFSLKHGILATNTGERLRELWDREILSVVEYNELLQAYYYMMQLRLLNQSDAIRQNDTPNNFIDPKSLTKIERVTLKEILKVLDKYQTKLSVQFTGSFLK